MDAEPGEGRGNLSGERFPLPSLGPPLLPKAFDWRGGGAAEGGTFVKRLGGGFYAPNTRLRMSLS